MENISPTLLCKDIIQTRKKQNLPIINFGLGENPIKQPSLFIEALHTHADKKFYTSSEGIPELNQTLKNIYHTKNTEYDILLGNGLKELLFIIQLAFVGKIFHITPSWVSYKEQINILNKNDDLIEIKTTFQNKYKINLEHLDNTLQEYNTYNKIIIFNNPNNPLGIAMSNTEIKQLAQVFKKNNCLVIADEIYLNLTYQKISSISKYIPDLTIRCSSISKDLGCGGYRLGWLGFPKTQQALFKKCKNLASSIYSCTCTPIQYATNSILTHKSVIAQHFTISTKIYKLIAKKVCTILAKHNIDFIKPNACWYLFVNFDKYRNQLAPHNIHNSADLCLYLLNSIGFVSVGGESFNCTGLNLRLSLVDFDVVIHEKNNTYENLNIARIITGINMLCQKIEELVK